MERCYKGKCRIEHGGIKSLAGFVEEHREAVEADLLIKTGYELRDIGSSLSWGALNSFIKKSSMDSHLIRELSPEDGLWATRSKTNAILADIFDMLAIINANLVAMGSRKRAKQPKPYKRPGDKEAQNIKKYGKGAVTVPELEAFFDQKRKEHEARHGRNDRSSTSHRDDSAQHEGGSS